MEDTNSIDKEQTEGKSTKWKVFYWGLVLFLLLQIIFFLWITNTFNK
jgi:hypothetical protein